MSNLLLILLWYSPEKISREIVEKVAFVGTVYSADAVNFIVKSLYEKYNDVDTVIVYGPDLNGAGELIVQALRGMCNDALRIPCEYVKNLGVNVVDLRWKSEEELRKAVYSLYNPKATLVRPRIEIKLETPEKRLPYYGPHILYDNDLEALRSKAIDYILTYGVDVGDVIYNILILQLKTQGVYVARPCDVLREWPCGLDKAAALLATPAFIQKRDIETALPMVRLEIYKRDVYDPHGNFVLADKLYHYGPRGILLRQLELNYLNIRREAQKLLPDHSFYLGKEYAAYRILKDRYLQDRWENEIENTYGAGGGI